MIDALQAQPTVLLELSLGKGDPADSQVQSFFNAYCRAFLAWQFVEAKLSGIFSRFVVGKPRPAMMASYHSVLSLETRLGMIDSAAQVHLKGEYLMEEWLDLHKKVSKRVANRNNLVHFTVTTVASKNGVDYGLLSTVFDPLATAQLVDAVQLDGFRDDFIELADALRKFEEKLVIRFAPVVT